MIAFRFHRRRDADVHRRQCTGPGVLNPIPIKEAWNRKLSEQFAKGNRWAILIGVDGYAKHPLVGPVNNKQPVGEGLNGERRLRPERNPLAKRSTTG